MSSTKGLTLHGEKWYTLPSIIARADRLGVQSLTISLCVYKFVHPG